MYRKELSQALRNALTLSIISVISVVLVGCLDQGGSGSEFADQAAPNGAAPNGATPNGVAPTGNNAPMISGNQTTAIDIGSAYAFTPTASDLDGDELTFSVRNQPSWADFDNTTGELSGQPELGSVGAYASIEISVSDGKAETALPIFAISVDQVGTVSTTLS